MNAKQAREITNNSASLNFEERLRRILKEIMSAAHDGEDEIWYTVDDNPEYYAETLRKEPYNFNVILTEQTVADIGTYIFLVIRW